MLISFSANPYEVGDHIVICTSLLRLDAYRANAYIVLICIHTWYYALSSYLLTVHLFSRWYACSFLISLAAAAARSNQKGQKITAPHRNAVLEVQKIHLLRTIFLALGTNKKRGKRTLSKRVCDMYLYSFVNVGVVWTKMKQRKRRSIAHAL